MTVREHSTSRRPRRSSRPPSGAAVAKHGNRAASSAAGSADVLDELGIVLDQSPERTARSIDELGFGFMFARAHHPAMRHVAAVRQELGIRTVFNVLGPLANPAGACDGVFGVYSADLAPTYAEALAELGARSSVRRPRRWRARRALAVRHEPRRRGRRRRRPRVGARPARSRHRADRPRNAARRLRGGERRHDQGRSSTARWAGGGMPFC